MPAKVVMIPIECDMSPSMHMKVVMLIDVRGLKAKCAARDQILGRGPVVRIRFVSALHPSGERPSLPFNEML